MSRIKGGGLEGVVASPSAICNVDGIEGRLSYRGIDIHDLVANSTFEETAYLLWHGQLPSPDELARLESRLAEARQLPPSILHIVSRLPASADPMAILRTIVSALGTHDPGAIRHTGEADLSRAILLTAKIPTIIASYHQTTLGLEVIAPRHDLSLAANFLYMLTGVVPTDRASRIMDQCLILHADHEFNASTFAGRVAAGTLSDLYSAVTAAIGTLAGPLHGGANEQVMALLEEIGTPDMATEHARKMLAEGLKVPGFGHRVYKTEDPRAFELRRISAEMAMEAGDSRWYEMSRLMEEFMIREKGINANVDLYSASVYRLLGIPTRLFTTVFAMSRVVGWTAHDMEQYEDNRLIRPVSDYVGPLNVPYLSMAERAKKGAAA